MKRIVLAGIAAAGLATASHAQSFPSVNSVGFVPVTVPAGGQVIQVGCNFQSFGGLGSTGVVDLFGSNQLVRANSAANATRIIIWDAGATNYVTVYQRLDGRYRLTTGAYTNFPIRSGDGFWLQSPTTDTVDRVIYLGGELVAGSAVQRTVPAGLTLVCNPFATPWYLNGTNMTWVIDGAKRGAVGSGDNIFRWNGLTYDRYYLRTANSNWVSAVDNSVVTNPIPVGASFWYQARATNFTSKIPRLTSM